MTDYHQDAAYELAKLGDGPFTTIEQVKQANHAAGLHFFDPEAVRFFHSRTCSAIYFGRVFVTSECREPTPYVDVRGQLQPATERYWTVRVVSDDGHMVSMETPDVFDFQRFTSRGTAIRFAATIAKLAGEYFCESADCGNLLDFDSIVAGDGLCSYCSEAVTVAPVDSLQ